MIVNTTDTRAVIIITVYTFATLPPPSSSLKLNSAQCRPVKQRYIKIIDLL